MPDSARSNGVAFAADSSIYIGLGWNGRHAFKDFHKYTPATNQWDTLSDYPADGQRGAAAVYYQGKAYVGGGAFGLNGLVENSFYEYDIATDNWTQKASFPFAARTGGIAFTLDSLIYYGLGHNHTSDFKDLWAYNPNTNSWTKKADLPGLPRLNAVVFTLNGKAIVGGGNRVGSSGQTTLADYYEYDPDVNVWRSIQVTFSDSSRTLAAATSNSKYGYFFGGMLSNNTVKKDFYQYQDTTLSTSIEENHFNNSQNLVLYPNPNNGVFNIKMEGSSDSHATIRVVSKSGQLVYENQLSNIKNQQINLESLSNGLYFISIQQNQLRYTSPFIVTKH